MSALAIESIEAIDAEPAGPEELADGSLAPGSMLGRYRIVRRLAVGGMAELYLAYAVGVEGFQKIVALKRALPALALDPAFVTMFLDEARLAATLSHPNIGQVYDVGIDGHSHFFAMEYVDGRDTRVLLKEAVRRGERMPIAIAVGIGCGVAAGLHSAHENRAPDRTPLHIVHRDISPANVIVTFGGIVKLIDFGIAKAARRRTVSVAGQLKGKAGYMSPEQCTTGKVDRRSDVFSLGVLLYELTTTRRLFKGPDEYSTMKMIVEGDIKPPSQIVQGYPRDLEDIVMYALAKHPDERYQTARALHLDLVRFAHGRGLDVTEYDLSAYVERLLPGEEARPIFDAELGKKVDNDSGPNPILRLPTVTPLASLPAPPRAHTRGSSLAETMISHREEVHQTTIFTTDEESVEADAVLSETPVGMPLVAPAEAPVDAAIIGTSPREAAAATAVVTLAPSPPPTSATRAAFAAHIERWWLPLLIALGLVTMFVTGYLIATRLS